MRTVLKVLLVGVGLIPVLGVPLFVGFGTLFGVLLGWLQIRSRSVVAPTVGHAALNAVASAPLLLLRGVDPAVAGVVYSPLGLVVLLAVILALVRSGELPRVPQTA